MNISTREFKDFVRKQELINSQLLFIKEAILELARDEISQSLIVKLGKASKLLDAGKGKRFSSLKDFKKYLKSL